MTPKKENKPIDSVDLLQAADEKYRALRRVAERVWAGSLPNKENTATCLVSAVAIDELGRILWAAGEEVVGG